MSNRAIRTDCLRRLRALLVLRDQSLADLAKRLVVSHAHLRLVILQARRPSEDLRGRLHDELTAEEWQFVYGESDALRVSNSGDRS